MKNKVFIEKNNIIEFSNVSFSYDKKHHKNNYILHNLSFDVKKSEFITILGPSGSGKSTILRLIGGFEQLNKNSGKIFYNSKNLMNISPNKSNIRTIFQNLGLFPHMNVFENVAYSLVVKKKNRNFINKEVEKYLKLVNLVGMGNKKINELSGGQKQRVAIARALISKPDVLLLDEPFSSLDIKLKKELEVELMKIQEKTVITFILVTHDQEQALFLSDKIMVIDNGKIIQQGTPQNIYDEPINEWVAAFIGDSNIFKSAKYIANKKVQIGDKKFVCADSNFKNNELVTAIIRPEDIKITTSNSSKAFYFGTIFNTSYKGIYWDTIIETKKFSFNVQTTKYYKEGIKVGIYWEKDAIHLIKNNV